MVRCLVGGCVAALALCAGGAQASVLDFNSLVHGEIVSTQFVGSHGVTISGDNFNRSFDIVAAFDSQETGTADPDLEGPPWTSGNLSPNTVLSKMLILSQTNAETFAGSGILADPNDEGQRPAGEITFSWDREINRFGFDIIDVEGTMEENGMIWFFKNGGMLTSVEFSDFTDNVSPHFDPTIVFGNNSANRLPLLTSAALGIGAFDEVVVRLGGSGAIDNVVPAPSGAAALAALGLFGLGRRRR